MDSLSSFLTLGIVSFEIALFLLIRSYGGYISVYTKSISELQRWGRSFDDAIRKGISRGAE